MFYSKGPCNTVRKNKMIHNGFFLLLTFELITTSQEEMHC